MLSSRQIERQTKPQLSLHIIESLEIAEKDIIINPQGYFWSERNRIDGVTVFGTYDGSQGADDLIQISTCDYPVSQCQTGFGLKHFCIFYLPQETQYKILDLYSEFGTFFLISQPLQVFSNTTIAFGSSIIVFSVNKNIQIKILAGAL